MGLRPRKLAFWVTVAAYFNLNNPVLCGLTFNGWLVQEAVGPGVGGRACLLYCFLEPVGH